MAVGGSKRRGEGSNGHLDFTFQSNLSRGGARCPETNHRRRREKWILRGKPFRLEARAGRNAAEQRHQARQSDGSAEESACRGEASRRVAVEIIVEDEGPGFDRGLVPDPRIDENLRKCSGRGIFLIETRYMSKGHLGNAGAAG